ncbi:immunity 49 family protein [Streptomyces yangpuensis]|uniref:immunity 49 family protein n=1 Tax=Streptomyces yangpuensis TaxID=1648182 RepID=UPI001F3C6CC0|nr:immunity 49 family protein [Streptomyces yangpuensis]
MRYARVVADELVFAYAFDGPTSVRSLTDGDVERVGIEELGQAAYANLMRVPVGYEEITLEGRATLHSVFGDSHFVASKALYLGELARQVTGKSLPSAGALVVVPTRHLLAFHPIADGSVVDALNDLAMYALGAYEDGPGSLSPRVYWWYRGGLTSLTVVDEETRTLSLKPPQELVALMKGLVRLDGAGRILAGRDAPDPAELTRTTIESVARLAEDPSGLGDAFASALALAHVRCTADPVVSELDTWDAWATAVRLGTALFAGSGPEQWFLGEANTLRLPATPAAPPPDARAWLDAVYLALACRAHDQVARLCRVPLETLRQDDSVDAYVLHWADTLRTYLSGGTGDAVVEKLLATMQASLPEMLTHSPDEFVNRVDYQPVALFHRLFTGDHEAFRGALTEALAEHGGYWGDSGVPRARVALGPLAMACLAHDQGFPMDPERLPHLPRYLVDGKRVEDIS